MPETANIGRRRRPRRTPLIVPNDHPGLQATLAAIVHGNIISNTSAQADDMVSFTTSHTESISNKSQDVDDEETSESDAPPQAPTVDTSADEPLGTSVVERPACHHFLSGNCYKTACKFRHPDKDEAAVLAKEAKAARKKKAQQRRHAKKQAQRLGLASHKGPGLSKGIEGAQ